MSGALFFGRTLRLQVRRARLPLWADILSRLAVLTAVAVLLATIIIPAISEHLFEKNYALTDQESSLLPTADPILAKDISFDAKSGDYSFKNNAKTAGNKASGQAVSSDNTMITANLPRSASSGLTVTDPVNNVDFKTTPEFALTTARQDSSHVYYPFSDGNGQLVFSPQASDVLEDLVLRTKSGNSRHFDYSLGLGNNLAARQQHDGSINIYGSSLSMLGTISTDNAKDAALVQKAQAKAPKDKLLFTIPAPTVRESGQGRSVVKASYALLNGGNTLRINATNLNKASYPLDIDPTVSVASVSQLYRDTNGESNVDFNTSNGTINRGAVTGGVINETVGWTTNANNLNTSRFLSSAVVSNGYVYVAGGAGTSPTNFNSIEYAQISTTNNTIGAWSTTTNLPASLSQFRLLTYNGYLYVIGGSSGSAGCGSASANVYYNPTQPNGALASSWTSTTALPAALCSMGAAIYNNTIYVVGGQTAAGGGTATVYYASLLPNGAIGSWTTITTSLPTSIYGEDVQIYNGYIYAIGGISGSTTQKTIYRAALSTSGGIYGSGTSAWTSLPNSFSSADGNLGLTNIGGGSFSTVNDGYMYISGGCNTVNGTYSCTAVSSSSYIAQINADGTLGPWSLINLSSATGVKTNTEVGGSLLVFANYVYSVAGCAAMTSTAIQCSSSANTLNTQLYSQILTAGQLSPVSSQANTLPTGLYEESTVVNNGYIYVIGGCKTNSCQTGNADTSGAIYYATISASGAIGAWSTSAYNINGTGNTGGIAAAAAVVYDNYIYVLGGYNNNANSQNIWYAQINTATGDLTASFAAASSITGATAAFNRLNVAAEYSNSAITVGTSGGNAYIFVFGGCSAAGQFGCSTYYTTNYRYTVGPTGPVINSLESSSTFPTTLPPLPDAHDTANNCATLVETTWTNACYTGEAAMGAAYYNGYIYLAGGADDCGGTNPGNCGTSSGQSSVVQYAQISNGTLGAWNYATNFLPDPLRRTAAYAYNDNLYVVGGHNALDHSQTANGTTYAYIDIAKINQTSGDLSSTIYASASQLVTNEWDGGVTFADGTVYEVGGCIVGYPPVNCTSRGTQTQSFQIYNDDNSGTGSWSNATNSYSTITGGANTAGSSATTYTVPSTNQTYIYVAGGCTTYTVSVFSCTSPTAMTGYTSVNSDGSLGTWAAGAAQLPTASSFGCLLQANGYLYYIGGINSANTAISTVYYSQIQSSGQPGNWTLASNVLPTATGRMGCDSSNGVLYVSGGYTSASAYSNNTYYVAPGTANAGDIATSWSTGSSTFTTARADVSSVVAGGYLYVLGGYDGSTYTGTITATATNGGKAQFTTAATANLNVGQVITMSGTTSYNGTWTVVSVDSATKFTISASYVSNNTAGTWTVAQSPYSEVQYVAINPTTGAMTGTWAYTNSFPYPASQTSVTVANGYMYVFGGRTDRVSGTNCSQTTFIAPILGTGQLGIWTQGINNFTTARVAAATAYANGYYYVMGGAACGTGVITTAAIQYSGSQSPTTASYFTRYADLGGDASPELFLSFVTNAQINSTDIEDWKMAYITATQESNVWGVATYINPLTSGTVTNVYAYDNTGTQVYLNRYVQLAFTISMTKSFTFPDTTPPSVNAYYLYYSPAPQTRLRNGKDFQDEQQQGLDLNY